MKGRHEIRLDGLGRQHRESAGRDNYDPRNDVPAEEKMAKNRVAAQADVACL